MYIEQMALSLMSSHNEYRRMANELNPKSDADQPIVYQIRLKGHLGSQWVDWFGGLSITLEDNGDTLITGPVIDQAELHGLLKKVRDLGMPLVSISPVEPGEVVRSDLKAQNKTGSSFNKTPKGK